MNSNFTKVTTDRLICPACRHKNRRENKYCTNCGEGLDNSAEIGPCLTILTKEGSSVIFQLQKGKNTIGRNIKNTIVINDDHISNFHATVLFEKGQSKIIDLGSRNGVYLNGKKVRKSALLKDGHLIKLGSTFLRFESTRENEIIKKVS